MIYFENKTRKGTKYCAVTKVERPYTMIVIYKYDNRGTRWYWRNSEDSRLHSVTGRFIKKIAPRTYAKIRENAGLRGYNG